MAKISLSENPLSFTEIAKQSAHYYIERTTFNYHFRYLSKITPDYFKGDLLLYIHGRRLGRATRQSCAKHSLLLRDLQHHHRTGRRRHINPQERPPEPQDAASHDPPMRSLRKRGDRLLRRV